MREREREGESARARERERSSIHRLFRSTLRRVYRWRLLPAKKNRTKSMSDSSVRPSDMLL